MKIMIAETEPDYAALNAPFNALFNLEAPELDSSDFHWEEFRVGDYLIWLNGGLHCEMNWQYGFQYQPRKGQHGQMSGPLFEHPSPRNPADFDEVKALAIEMVLLDGQDPHLSARFHRF
jgi:hypothetical protein